MTRHEECFWAKVEKTESCWFWKAAKNSWGYGAFTILPQRRMIGAHRLSYEMHFGIIPGDLQVCHKCDNPACVNPDHLFLGTVLDNRRDCVSKGRQAYGEKNGRAKLTVQQVREIRASSESLRSIAKRYGVSQALISAIRSRKLWGHVT